MIGQPALQRLATLAVALLMGACARGPGNTDAPTGGDTGQAPADELTQLCAHSYELLIAPTGAGSPAVREDFMASCVVNSEARRAAASPAEWAQRSACVLAATDGVALGICDGREPPPEAPKSGAPSIQPSQVCKRIVELMQREMGPMATSEVFEDFVEQCVPSLEEQLVQDAAEYERAAACVMRAQTIEAMSSCGD